MKVILFGAGHWGKNYIRELGSHLVGVVEPNEKVALKTKAEFGVRVFSHLPYDLMFDGAIIATPPTMHMKIAAPLLDEGKYVLVEKPLSHSLAELQDLNNTRRCMSSLVYLYHPVVDDLKDIFLDGYIGSHAFSVRTNNGPIRSWKDALWDLAPHDISIFNYIVGSPPSKVEAFNDTHFAFLRLKYDRMVYGKDASLCTYTYVGWIGGPKVRRVEFLDAKGGNDRIIFDDVRDSASLEESPLRLMIDDFLTGDWSEAKASFEAGLDVVATLEKASKT